LKKGEKGGGVAGGTGLRALQGRCTQKGERIKLRKSRGENGFGRCQKSEQVMCGVRGKGNTKGGGGKNAAMRAGRIVSVGIVGRSRGGSNTSRRGGKKEGKGGLGGWAGCGGEMQKTRKDLS